MPEQTIPDDTTLLEYMLSLWNLRREDLIEDWRLFSKAAPKDEPDGRT